MTEEPKTALFEAVDITVLALSAIFRCGEYELAVSECQRLFQRLPDDAQAVMLFAAFSAVAKSPDDFELEDKIRALRFGEIVGPDWLEYAERFIKFAKANA